MTGQDFERALVHALNDHALLYKINLIAYRRIQTRYQRQLFDVLVDSEHEEFYMALECKSIDASKDKTLNFRQHFHVSKGVHQLNLEYDWLALGGRHGFLVVELRNFPSRRSTCYFLPFGYVYGEFSIGRPSLSVDDIVEFPSCVKQCGKYIFDDQLMQHVLSQE